MNTAIIDAIQNRVSTNLFDAGRPLSSEMIEELVRLAVRAPSAYNLQNWRFIAVRTPEAKARLQAAAYEQEKVADAAVTFIVCGQRPRHDVVEPRLRPSVEAGFMPEQTIGAWADAVARTYGDDPQMQRDEAIRSASFGAAFLIFAAQAHGLASGPMVGFDPLAVAGQFNLRDDEIPVLLVAVGYPRDGNWPQKPRRPIAGVMTTV